MQPDEARRVVLIIRLGRVGFHLGFSLGFSSLPLGLWTARPFRGWQTQKAGEGG
jgi:hypothetical protein